jgi:hypothetical protein
MEVAWIALRRRLVNREIHGDFVAVGDLTRESACQSDAAESVKFRGQYDLVFTCHARVVAFLCVLGCVPKPLAIPRPPDRLPLELRWQEDFSVQYITAPRVIEQLTRTFIANALAGAIGGRGSGTASRAPRDGADLHAKDGHISGSPPHAHPQPHR